MRSHDLFVEIRVPSDGLWNMEDTVSTGLDEERLEYLVGHRDPECSDVEMGVALAHLASDEFEEYGTAGKTSISDDQAELVMKALRAVTKRLGILAFDPPFRDFPTFRTYWGKNGGYGSWQARREMVDEHFGPLRRLLDEREAKPLRSTLAEPISPRPTVGWPGVDEEIFELRRHFESAVTEQDYSNVGNDAVAVVEALSRVVYVHAIHGTPGSPEPAINQTKDRLGRFIEFSLSGSENAALRKLARAAIEVAQETKHRRSGDRRSAGIAADSVILLANILRRIDPDQGAG